MNLSNPRLVFTEPPIPKIVPFTGTPTHVPIGELSEKRYRSESFKPLVVAGIIDVLCSRIYKLKRWKHLSRLLRYRPSQSGGRPSSRNSRRQNTLYLELGRQPGYLKLNEARAGFGRNRCSQQGRTLRDLIFIPHLALVFPRCHCQQVRAGRPLIVNRI